MHHGICRTQATPKAAAVAPSLFQRIGRSLWGTSTAPTTTSTNINADIDTHTHQQQQRHMHMHTENSDHTPGSPSESSLYSDDEFVSSAQSDLPSVATKSEFFLLPTTYTYAYMHVYT